MQPALERSSGMKAGVDFGLAMNPEFLREGSSIRDFYEASRTIIGANDDRSAQRPLVDAELNRQFPGRELQKAQTPEGLREGWVAVQAARQTTVASTPTDLVDAHVEDEWSLAQTLRHLILATDAWLRGGILHMQQPFHEIGQIFTGADEVGFDMSIFRVDPPAYEEILAVRAERQQQVTDFLATATAELLAEERENPWGGGDWRPSVGDCIRVILEEEWAHLRYIRRDLARLQ